MVHKLAAAIATTPPPANYIILPVHYGLQRYLFACACSGACPVCAWLPVPARALLPWSCVQLPPVPLRPFSAGTVRVAGICAPCLTPCFRGCPVTRLPAGELASLASPFYSLLVLARHTVRARSGSPFSYASDKGVSGVALKHDATRSVACSPQNSSLPLEVCF